MLSSLQANSPALELTFSDKMLEGRKREGRSMKQGDNGSEDFSKAPGKGDKWIILKCIQFRLIVRPRGHEQKK